MLGSNVRDDNAVLSVDLTNPDIFSGDQIVLQKDTLHVVRTTFIWQNTAYQRLGIRNYGMRPVGLRIALRFESDFADLFEVRGLRRKRRGRSTQKVADGHQVILSYQGLDGVIRRSVLSFDPPPAELAADKALYHWVLAAGQITRVFLSVGCDTIEGGKVVPFTRAMIAAHRERRAATSGSTTVESSNELLNEVLCRSAADLAMLITETPQGRYPYAGIPWYSTTFGRDGIITALQMLWFEPKVARGVLRRLAFLQAETDDPAADAQPGKILHEMRAGEMAALGEVPFRLYYGTVDATPLFVLLAGAYFARTGDLETVTELWPAVEAALLWIDRYGDADGDGFVEYRRTTERGLANQGWKDLFDAIFHADGSLVEGNIALAEVQGYVFAAKLAAARCARALDLLDRAAALERQAAELARRFEATFWCPELGTYALALDGDKNPCHVPTSNAGQVLFSGIASPERAAAVAHDLLGPRFFSGWGIRTVAKDAARYNPDVLSQWLDLAARQRPDRAGIRAVRAEVRGNAGCSRACSMRRHTWNCAGCRSCSAASSGNGAADRRSIRSHARRRPGPARRHSLCWKHHSAWNSILSMAKSVCGTHGCRRSSMTFCYATFSSVRLARI